MSITWSQQELMLLHDNYDKGIEYLSELLPQHSAGAIKAKLNACGLNRRSASYVNRVSGPLYPEGIAVDGKVFEDLLSISIKFGVPYSALRARVANGESPQEAVSRTFHSRVEIRYAGEVYLSLNSARKKAGINATTLYNIIRDNPKATLQECFDIAVHRIYNSTRSVSKRSSFGCVAPAFINSEGEQVYYVYCPQCRRVLLLTGEMACTASHGEVCTTQELPMGAMVPTDFKIRVNKLFDVRLTLEAFG